MELVTKLLMGLAGLTLTLAGSVLLAPVFTLSPASIEAGFGLLASLTVGTLMIVPGWMLLTRVVRRREVAEPNIEAGSPR